VIDTGGNISSNGTIFRRGVSLFSSAFEKSSEDLREVVEERSSISSDSTIVRSISLGSTRGGDGAVGNYFLPDSLLLRSQGADGILDLLECSVERSLGKSTGVGLESVDYCLDVLKSQLKGVERRIALEQTVDLVLQFASVCLRIVLDLVSIRAQIS
jgi:hypothetical protein